MCLESSHDYRYTFGKSATEVMSYLISASHQGYVMSRFLITGDVHCDLLVKVICYVPPLYNYSSIFDHPDVFKS